MTVMPNYQNGGITPGADIWRPAGDRGKDLCSILDFTNDVLGVTDLLPAIVRAMAQSNFIWFPPNFKGTVNGKIAIPNGMQFMGPGLIRPETATANGTPQLKFTGTDTACFENADMGVGMLYVGIQGIGVWVTGTYNWIADFRKCVGVNLRNMRWAVDDAAGNVNCSGFRSQKFLSNDSSWVNDIQNFHVRIPDASTGRPFDQDWSDSSVMGANFVGGIGSAYRGTGAVNTVSSRFNIATNGVTVFKETESPCTHAFTACEFDQVTNGVRVEGKAADGLTDDRIMPSIIGCHFRGISGTEIVLINNTGRVLHGPTIGLNMQASIARPRLSVDNAANWIFDNLPPRVIWRVGTPKTAVTGTTAKTLLDSFVLRGYEMGPYGRLEVHLELAFVGTAGAKTLGMELASTAMASFVVGATNLGAPVMWYISNKGSITLQIGMPAGLGGPGVSTNSPNTGAVNTALDQTISFYTTNASAADSAQIVDGYAMLIPG